MSASIPPVPSAPPVPVEPPRRPWPPLAAALVVGLLLGGGGVGAAWALGGDDGSSGAAGDARDGCQALDGFEESDYTADGAKGEIAMNRFAAATVLSASAAAGDAEFKPFAEAMREAQNQYARTFDLANGKVQKPLKTARAFCADL
ncbi:hypothetical protein [Streptomyces sp. NPDC057877]|uniref:hypothetical protein n=1 Tax=Streptomyces sp. NPDC057877 TaxID=3346269 RepID=UPI0036CD1536